MAYFYENGWRRLRTGDAVHEVEGRHVGRVEAIENSSTVKIKWDDTGWISYIPLSDVVKAESR
jgi:hypothetical protein